MVKKDESMLASWTAKASDAEERRYEWTKQEIYTALEDCSFGGHSFEVYPKGSYPNYTNVVRDSDVDIAVELTGLLRHEFIHSAKNMTMADFGLTRYSGNFGVFSFKDEVEVALRRHFGAAAIERGNKAIHVQETRRGLKADVVVCQTLISHTSKTGELQGIRIQPDRGDEIHNYPKQHYSQGVSKNNDTARRFKRLVRIVKRLENEMVLRDQIEPVPSFLIESLIWNLPNSIFAYPTWTERLRRGLAYIVSAEKEKDEWLEVNKIKYLFHSSQNWTEQQADSFGLTALKYLGMI